LGNSKETLDFFYVFKFADGSIKKFEISLDSKTLNYIPQNSTSPPDWAKQSYHRCPNCSLDQTRHEFCPIAVNISDVINEFKDFSAYENVTVFVMSKTRDMSKNTTLQEGISSLLGIYMVTSGCPIMDKLKPLVRYHLPFSTLEESVFRIVGMYLLIQYYLKNKGKKPDWELKKLDKIYEDIRLVNANMKERLKGALIKDASLSALANLDNFASVLPILINDTLANIEDSFSAYLTEQEKPE
jgi:hypothetical protein